MDSRELDVLKILLENGQLQFHQIQSKIRTEYERWGLRDDNVLRVTLVKVLGKLLSTEIGQVLIERKDLGHRNVQYALKDEMAKQKVEMMTKNAISFWRKIFTCYRELEKTKSEAEVLGTIIESAGPIILFSYFYKICLAHSEQNRGDETFYIAETKKTMDCFLDLFYNELERIPPYQTKKYLEKEDPFLASFVEGDVTLLESLLNKLEKKLERKKQESNIGA